MDLLPSQVPLLHVPSPLVGPRPPNFSHSLRILRHFEHLERNCREAAAVLLPTRATVLFLQILCIPSINYCSPCPPAFDGANNIRNHDLLRVQARRPVAALKI